VKLKDPKLDLWENDVREGDTVSHKLTTWSRIVLEQLIITELMAERHFGNCGHC
jgi:hypothetical protein